MRPFPANTHISYVHLARKALLDDCKSTMVSLRTLIRKTTFELYKWGIFHCHVWLPAGKFEQCDKWVTWFQATLNLGWCIANKEFLIWYPDMGPCRKDRWLRWSFQRSTLYAGYSPWKWNNVGNPGCHKQHKQVPFRDGWNRTHSITWRFVALGLPH